MIKMSYMSTTYVLPELRIRLFIALVLLLQNIGAHAENDATKNQSSENIINLLDEPRNYLSTTLLGFSDRIDQIFSNTQNFSANNTSFARISIASVWLDQGRPYPLTEAYVYLSLPRTQDKYSLLLQTDNTDESQSTGINLLPGSPAQRSSALAIRGNIINGTNWSVTADLGSKLSTTLDPFVRVSYKQKNQFENWSLFWQESIYSYLYQGNGIDSRLHGDYPVNDRFHLRFSNQLSLLEQNSYIDHSHSLALFQRLNAQSALSYSIGYYTESDPADGIYYTQIRYKSLLHDTWLYYELIPEYIYPKSTHFRATPKFTLKFEMLLGNP